MRPLKIAVIAVVAVAVLVVGGTFVYINFIDDDAPEKLTLESEDGTTVPAGDDDAAGDVTGTWTAGAGSRAGYRVDEVLFGQDNTAVGRTEDVTGTLVIQGTTVRSASVEVDMTTVASDESRRDNQFKGRVMDVEHFPTATFRLREPIELGSVPPSGRTITAKAKGELTLHGTTKAVTVELSARRTGETIEVNGSIPIVFADYDIPNPSFGPITTKDHGELEFLVAYRRD